MVMQVLMARVTTLVAIVIDVLVLMFINQLPSRFQCLGAEIQLIQKTASIKKTDDFQRSLIKMVKIHQSLLE